MKQRNKYGYLKAEIEPSLKGDRVAFEFVLPRDAKEAVAITAVCIPGLNSSDYLDGEAIPSRNAGKLSFRYEGIGDIFMQMPVQTGLHFDDNNVFAQIQGVGNLMLNGPAFQYLGSQAQWEPISISGETRTIQGYYVDDLNAYSNVTESYSLTIYLRYLKRP